VLTGDHDDATAFLSTGGAHPSHALVAPSSHVERLWELTDQQVEAVFSLARDVADAQRRALDVDGINLAQANGFNQDIDHVHVHVVPKYVDDGKIHATDTGDEILHGWDTESFTDTQRQDVREKLAQEFPVK
jgi:diadenosine tetraphosphate (Ap4A) HIT family hydrolase